MKKKILGLIVLAFVLALVVAWRRGDFQSAPDVPDAQPVQNFPPPGPTPPPSSSLPTEINLAVPFTTQAPKSNWDADHEEFCEEAASLMAAAYINNFSLSNTDFADSKLYEIKDFEMQTFGYFKDTTVAETSRILTEYFGIKNVQLVNNPTLNDIKQTLAAGKVIIAPFAGRELGNPNFTGAGPLYHMLVIKGYTKEGKIITNDPGTRRGANYVYSSSTILNALHDWNGGDVDRGAKVMIVIGK